MQNDYNKDPFDDEEKKQQGQKDGQQNTPRWTPYEEQYKTVTKAEKPKKRWIIPLVIVLVVMVAAISVGTAFGAKRLSRMVKDSVGTEPAVTNENSDTAVIATTDTSNLGSSTVSGNIILTDVSDIVEEVIPSVVSITSRSLIDSGGYGDYWNFFFGGGYGNSGESSQEVESGIGSGTIISENSSELLILTSYHVVEGSSSLYVTFNDGASVDGYIKSQSEADDIAIVAVPLSDITEDTLSKIKIARLSTTPAAVGDGAIVIGNALGYGMSVTTGIISATDREINVDGKTLTVMQTDAAINSGNSGGCVLNSNGDIIGISEAKITISYVEGMCYAIPVSSNTELIQTLLNQEGSTNNATVQTNGQGAYLGIRGRDVDNTAANSYGKPKGVLVKGIIPGSGAEDAGILENDIIVGMDNVSFTTMSELQEQLSRHEPGDTVTLIIMREIDGSYSQVKVEVTLTESIS